MLSHYIVQALRSFWRFRVTAAVNLLGLVLAVVCFVGQKYTEQFTQRDVLSIWPFLLSLVITVGVAWASVGVQALRAATIKPARVLYAE